MRKSFKSLRATITGIEVSGCALNRSRRSSRRNTSRRRFAFEPLEQRTLLSGDGVFTRPLSDVPVAAYASVTNNPGTSNPERSFNDNGNEPDLTFAGGTAHDARSYEGASASGSITISAINPTAAGDSTTFPQAIVNTSLAGSASANTGTNASSTITGDGNAYGSYSIDAETVPEAGVFHAEFKLKAGSPLQEVNGDGNVEVASGHLVIIGYAGADNGDEVPDSGTWSIQAQSIGNASWYVTYVLPDGTLAFPSGTVINGGLDIDVSFDWEYSTQNQVTIIADVGYIYPYGRAFADAPSNSTAGYQFNASSYASLRLLEPSEIDERPIPGGFDPPLPEFAPPKVKNVTLSHPGSTHPAYEFDDNVGSGVQLKTVPVGNVNQIAIQFTKDVVIDSDDLELIALNKVVNEPTPTLIQAPDPTSNGNTAIWSLSAPLPAAQYLLRLNSANVVDTTDAAFALDGEWTNPGSTSPTLTTTVFPSGDNVAGGDFEFVFTILPGDANRTNQVNAGDFAILQSNYNQSGMTWNQADFNGNGTVNVGDFAILQANYYSDFQNLVILGDYDGDFDVDVTDVSTFNSYYGSSNSAADLDGDSDVDAQDDAAHDALFNFFATGSDPDFGLRVLN